MFAKNEYCQEQPVQKVACYYKKKKMATVCSTFYLCDFKKTLQVFICLLNSFQHYSRTKTIVKNIEGNTQRGFKVDWSFEICLQIL